MIGIAGEAVAGHLGINLGAARFGMFIFFKHHDAGAFAHDETVAVLIPWARGFFRRVVEAVESARHAAKPAMPTAADHRRFGAAGDHDIGIAEA